MSANGPSAVSPATMFLTHAQIRECGVSSADLRRGVAPGTLTWPLRPDLRLRLAPLLANGGFGDGAAISVRESRTPAGFELTAVRLALSDPLVRRSKRKRQQV